MKFAQKKFLCHKTTFEFGEQRLIYTCEMEEEKFGFSIPYENIYKGWTTHDVVEKWPLMTGCVLAVGMLICAVLMKVAPARWGITEISETLFYVLATITLPLMVTERIMRFDTTLIPTMLGNIIVFHDPQHGAITAEIEKRQKTAFRRRYADVDMLNDPHTEIAKFRFLKEEDYISEEEFKTAIRTIKEKGG